MAQRELQRLVPEASAEVLGMLDARGGRVQAPIRSEIFGPQRFAQHGRSLGLTHRAVAVTSRDASFFPRLRANIRMLQQAHAYIGTQAAGGYDISPAAEWLLDNFHLIEAQLQAIHDGLPRRYFRTLPVLQEPPLAGLPRVYGVAWAFVAHTDSAFDDDLLVQYLSAYEETCELRLAEMWALPTTLRVVLIENLRRLAERVATHKAAREVANLVSDRIGSATVPDLQRLHALLEERGVGPMFLAQLSQGLLDRGAGSRADVPGPVLEWLRAVLPERGAAQMQHAADKTADNLSVSNAVSSLRALGDADWPDIVARSSPLMRLMLTSPLFEAEDTGTRDQTLHGIERLARRSGQGEVAVAQTLLGLMHAADADPRSTASEHWLEGAGRRTLMRALGVQEGALVAARRALRHAALPLYLASVVLGTVALVAWMLLREGAPPAPAPGWAVPLAALTALLLALPASETVMAVIHRLISESARPQHLPRLALAGGIPPEHRVMVVVPALLSDAPAIERVVHRLHLHALANPEAQAQFALLSDWADADGEHDAADGALLELALQAIGRLNRLEPAAAGAPPRYLLLHRARSWCETEQRWIGWERKRGKLEQLVAALATDDATAFVGLGEASRIAAGTRYVVTLDSDTQLPPGRLRELVGVAAHPHNQPRLDGAGRRVVSGYGILQPHLVTPLPAPDELTPYHWLFAGQCGIDPYSAASSEVYQDLFAEGSYTGKGLLHVQALHAVLGGRLPEGRVLSHDLLEGSLARCAAVTDVAVIEDSPFHADVAASRIHRWTRGDWQLLPLLLQPRRYPLRAINGWKMADNLRRSLVAPGSLALLLLALAGWGVTPLAALALVLAAFTAGPLMGAVAGFAPSRDDLAKLYFYRQAGADLARALCGGLWQGALLLHSAWLCGDAIVRTLYRLTVSGRHLLQWTTAAAAHAAAGTTLAASLRQHRALPALAALLLGALLLARTPHPALAFALCALWAAAPVWAWWASRPRMLSATPALTPVEAAYLQDVARDTWRFFERCVVAADNHLPPDNLQLTPHEMVAHRTSPTNIGLYLLSVACARRFGWIDTPQLLARLEATLDTLDTLQRHRGHFLNWYDTQTRAPLLPMYVSTVDSGNLSGHLLALAQACLELVPGADDDGAPRLQALAVRCEALAWAADFSFLYHPKRHLLHIGLRVAEQQLDAGFYDLLASESRLTSLLAIAKGDLPVRHWAALGRPFYALGAAAGLRSWSGSMFEYLMPTLVLSEPQGSVLRSACRVALREQIAYAGSRGVPWGISESAYAGCDYTLAYQYAPQGVPRLALRRTPPDELVVAPYATMLAAQIDPRCASLNLAALQALAMRDQFGFIEALDYTPERQTEGQRCTPVATYMAHHQGMTIVALANVLLDGVVQRWGLANPHLEAMVSLLHERAPREVSMLDAPPAAPPPLALARRVPALRREVAPGAQAVEPTQLLSNGRYNVALRPNGAGCSRLGTLGITRWRDDALRDADGSFFYLRRAEGEPLVSLTQHPAPDAAAEYTSVLHADRVCFDAAWPELQAHVTAWVSAEDDIEFRQVELRNLGAEVQEIELVSAFELTLAEARADEAHPAFGKLFVRAEWQPAQQALVFERTPRLATEPALHAAHFLAAGDPQLLAVCGQTDRQRWNGRNRATHRPLGDFDPLPGAPDAAPLTLVTGLDPVCALSVRLRLEPGAKAQLTFATAASDNPGTLRAVIDKYRQPSHVQRASLMSATLAAIRLRALRISAEDFAAIQTLSTALALSLTRPQGGLGAADGAPPEVCDRRLLWRHGLSGEQPLLLVSASGTQALGLLRSLAQALRLWAWGGVACDLVVVNTEPASYEMPLQRDACALRDRHAADSNGPGNAARVGFYVLRADDLSAEELGTLRALARVRLLADGRALAHHVQAWAESHEQAWQARGQTSTTALRSADAGAAAVRTSRGEFLAETGEFGFEVSTRERPARPWINVLANPAFGAHVSEAGGGCTWALNSRLNQLTAWSNDPVADPPPEWWLLQDLDTRQAWSVAPSAWGNEDAVYRIRHGQGYSVIGHRRGDLEVSASWCVDATAAVKELRLVLVNHGRRTLRLRVIGIVEWMMGAVRADRATVHTALHRQRLPGARLSTLLCTQRERAAGFGDGTAFLALAGAADEAEDWTCDRRECFDARGRLVLPDHWGQRQGGGLDPCAALATRVELAGGGGRSESVFLLGYAASPDAARQLAATAAVRAPTQRLEEVRHQWDALLGATTVRTPDPLFDALVNRWLLYQTVSCRLWAKAGLYQAGGATGFRDQLQDTMALAWAAPALLRTQILLCASRQYPQGDVQHWWHAPGGAGVRTHFSDDLLWLPLACAHHIRATGELALLDEMVPFIEGATIPDGAEDVYETPRVSELQASVYEHAARTLDRSLVVGIHGLPLIGSGDWNDGMNRVGAGGRGESVWLGWFLCRVVADFAPLAHGRGETERARRWEQAALGWQAALAGPAWDGEWYLRAWFDDGQPLGASVNAEARIDLIAQAWSVLSGAAPAERQRQAMASAGALLVDREAGLIRLLDPPLARASPSAGYIQAYPPGVRENGGQYTHGAVWAVMAQAELARGAGPAEAQRAADLAWHWFTCLSPAHRAAHPTQGAAYGTEPYVVAGDVYTQPPYVGRGGWSWYTGAAAWLHRAAVESIFGLRLGASELSFAPCLPSHWPQAELTLRRDGRSMRFTLVRAGAAAALASATPADPQPLLLRPGERLRWQDLAPDSRFVIPLLADPALPPQAGVAVPGRGEGRPQGALG